MRTKIETELAAHFLDIVEKHHGSEGIDLYLEHEAREMVKLSGAHPLDAEDELRDNEPDEIDIDAFDRDAFDEGDFESDFSH
jgi:hypothetical protein